MEKKTYSVLDNIKYYMQVTMKYNRKLWIRSVIAIVTTTLLVVATSVLPSLFVYFLSQQTSLKSTSYAILGITVLMIIVTCINISSSETSKLGAIGIRVSAFSSKLVRKFLTMDYEMTEDEKIYKAYKQAVENGTGSNPCGGEAMYVQGQRFLQYLTIFLVFGIILSQFNPLAWVLVIVSGVINAYLLKTKRNYRAKTKDQRSLADARRTQLKRDAIKVENGKDARIYDVHKVYEKKIDDLREERLSYTQGEAKLDFRNRMIFDTLVVVRDLVIYIFLIQAVSAQTLSIPAFTLFFTTLTQFNAWMEEMSDALHLIGLASQDIDDMRHFLEVKDIQGGQAIQAYDEYTLQFNDVSYRYPNADKDTLSHLNFTLNPVESIALVGTNGAGKSTITNLMLGLLHPTSGSITLNGVDIQDLDRDAYFELFAPAFQENDLWALTLQQNLTMSKDPSDENELHEILSQVGLETITETLPKGLNTNMTTHIHLDGTNLSGGQTQKLMLGRALYKDAPILILDEPTAALDALAEQNLYEQYHTFSKHKSSLFISHRLSSTRFCDRILFLEHGRILESGTHDELMKHKGKYAEMYAIQSQYYQEEVKHHEETLACA